MSAALALARARVCICVCVCVCVCLAALRYEVVCLYLHPYYEVVLLYEVVFLVPRNSNLITCVHSSVWAPTQNFNKNLLLMVQNLDAHARFYTRIPSLEGFLGPSTDPHPDDTEWSTINRFSMSKPFDWLTALSVFHSALPISTWQGWRSRCLFVSKIYEHWLCY